MLLALLLLTGVGGVLGVLGAGGAALAVPVLVHVAGLTPAAAVVTSLALVAAASAIAALLHARRGQVDLRTAALFAGLGAPAAILGAQLTPAVPPDVLLGLFGGLLLLIGAAMLSGVAARVRPAAPGPRRHALTALGAVAVGGLTGFLGVGGGFLLVPALVWARGLDMRRAAGTSLAVITVNASIGLAAHLGDAIAVADSAGFIAVAAAGAVLGHAVADRIRREHIQRGFAALTIAVGGAVVATSLGCLPP
jgi:uncharacterized membrane protein YfcA